MSQLGSLNLSSPVVKCEFYVCIPIVLWVFLFKEPLSPSSVCVGFTNFPFVCISPVLEFLSPPELKSSYEDTWVGWTSKLVQLHLDTVTRRLACYGIRYLKICDRSQYLNVWNKSRAFFQLIEREFYHTNIRVVQSTHLSALLIKFRDILENMGSFMLSQMCGKFEPTIVRYLSTYCTQISKVQSIIIFTNKNYVVTCLFTIQSITEILSIYYASQYS